MQRWILLTKHLKTVSWKGKPDFYIMTRKFCICSEAATLGWRHRVVVLTLAVGQGQLWNLPFSSQGLQGKGTCTVYPLGMAFGCLQVDRAASGGCHPGGAGLWVPAPAPSYLHLCRVVNLVGLLYALGYDSQHEQPMQEDRKPCRLFVQRYVEVPQWPFEILLWHCQDLSSGAVLWKMVKCRVELIRF